MSPRILLTGKNGQVGSELLNLLPRVGAVVALDRQQLDLTKPAEIRRVIREIRPNVVVNPAAYTAVDLAEKEEALAHAINAEAPGVMAEEAKKIGASLVHYSTDYIFDGLKKSPYEEDDPPNPVSVYGKSKLAGEVAIRDSGVSHLIFRTAWVYATSGKNFLLTILRLASQCEELKIVRDQVGAPTWCRDIAAATTQVLAEVTARNHGALSFGNASGTYHLTAGGIASWYEFAESIVQHASQASPAPPWLTAATQNRPLLLRKIVPITTAEYPTPARRPPYSVLSNARLAETFGVRQLDWRNSLDRVFQLHQ